jgi:hypothetical protein
VTQSEKSEVKQGSTSNRIDLSAVASEHPVNQKIAVLDLNTFDATQLTLLEVLDMSETVGVPPEALGALLNDKRHQAQRMKMLYAMAWCIARRADHKLTFAEVCTWKLEVIGEVDKAKSDEAAKRAAIVVGAASVSGLPPREAEKLTVAELSAYGDRATKRNRAARRARR